MRNPQDENDQVMRYSLSFTLNVVISGGRNYNYIGLVIIISSNEVSSYNCDRISLKVSSFERSEFSYITCKFLHL